MLHIADLQSEIQASLLVDLNDDAARACRAEPRRLHLDAILAGGQIADLIFAVGGARRGALHARGSLRNRHGSVGDDGAARVGYDSKNSCVKGLARQDNSCAGQKQSECNFHCVLLFYWTTWPILSTV